MNTAKAVLKSSFLGGFLFACLGLFVGGVVVPPLVWPESNLGPLAGAIFGLLLGAVSGTVLGLLYVIARLTLARRRQARNLP